MSAIQTTQQTIIEEFTLFDDWMSRYEYLIELGGKLSDFPEEWKTQENKISGCQSQVWLHMRMEGDNMRISGISDAAIVSGLIAIVTRVYDGHPPQDILQAKPEFIAQIGFTDHLSPTRSNGLHSMLSAIFQKAKMLSSSGALA